MTLDELLNSVGKLLTQGAPSTTRVFILDKHGEVGYHEVRFVTFVNDPNDTKDMVIIE